MDGIRGVAAVAVLINHVRSHLATGVNFGSLQALLSFVSHGLMLFFALSGFLLYRPFVMSVLSGKALPSIKQFLVNRALRIYPGYWFALLMVALVLGLAYTRSGQMNESVADVDQWVGYITDPKILVADALLVHMFFPAGVKTGLGVSWTLSVEMTFYLVMPLLILAAIRIKKLSAITRVMLPAVLLLLVGIVSRVIINAMIDGQETSNLFYYEWGGNWYAVFLRSFLANADLFSFGMAAAVVWCVIKIRRPTDGAVARIRWASLFGAVVLAALGMVTEAADTFFAAASACLILFISLPRGDRQGLLARVLESWPFRYLGVTSYGLYLWHLPCIWLLNSHGLTFPQTAAWFIPNVLLVLAVTLAIATVSYFLIEKPALRLKRSMVPARQDGDRPNEPTPPLVAGPGQQ